MNPRTFACLALLWLCVLAPTALAQSLPAVREFYFDDDQAARPIRVVEGSDDAAVDQLMRTMERRQRHAELATAQLAHIALAGGRAETAHALYRQALDTTAPRSTQRQQVQWNYGWDLLRAGDAEGALVQFAGVMEGRRQQPEWLPPTLALALWRLDRRAEAVAWFAAAVRTHPDRWPYAANLPALLPDWRDDERATLAQVQAAWVANPPAWP